MELTHEAESGAGFDALLQADMQLESLIGLSALLGFDDKLRLDDASGEARLWGRWQDGRLADVRLDVSSPRLALNRDLPAGEEQPGIVLDDMSLRGQWLRDAEGEGWEAWFAGDARSVDSPYEHSDGPPLPRFWHARGEGGDWRITGSGFELGALSAWRDRLPCPKDWLAPCRRCRPEARSMPWAWGGAMANGRLASVPRTYRCRPGRMRRGAGRWISGWKPTVLRARCVSWTVAGPSLPSPKSLPPRCRSTVPAARWCGPTRGRGVSSVGVT